MNHTNSRLANPSMRLSALIIFFIFLIICCATFFICNSRVYLAKTAVLAQTQELLLSRAQSAEQSLMHWRNQIVDEACILAASEKIRAFINASQLSSAAPASSLNQTLETDSEEEIFWQISELSATVQRLLNIYSEKYGWLDVRLLGLQGQQLLATSFSEPLHDYLRVLARQSLQTCRPHFGPIRSTDHGSVTDLALPVPTGQAATKPLAAAALIITIPLESGLETIFTAHADEGNVKIISQSENGIAMTFPVGATLLTEQIAENPPVTASFSFRESSSLEGDYPVYSTGMALSSPPWLLLAEKPVSSVDSEIGLLSTRVYIIGALMALLGTALAIVCWQLGFRTENSRWSNSAASHPALIQNMRFLLDCVNSTFKEGLLLIESTGKVLMFNKEFAQLCIDPDQVRQGISFANFFLPDISEKLLQDIQRVLLAAMPANIELKLPVKKDGQVFMRLFRLTLYPMPPSKTSPQPLCCIIFQDITDFRRHDLAEQEKMAKAAQRQEALISAFTHAIEGVEPELAGHSEKMAGLADLLAPALEMTDDQTETLRLAARLSQLGKLYVPRHLLAKKEKLTPEELAQIRRAPEYADKILNDLNFDLPVAETVSMLGEKMDGTGVPKGLSGEEIPLTGRALAVINAFIAMTSQRLWRKTGRLSIDDALSRLREDAGYDQKIVESLAQLPYAEITRMIGASQTKNPS